MALNGTKSSNGFNQRLNSKEIEDIGKQLSRALIHQMHWVEPLDTYQMYLEKAQQMIQVGYSSGPLNILLGTVNLSGHMRLEAGEGQFANIMGQVKDTIHFISIEHAGLNPAEKKEFYDILDVARKHLGGEGEHTVRYELAEANQKTPCFRWSWQFVRNKHLY